MTADRIMVAVLADGVATFLTADADTGTIDEWARLRVGRDFTGQQAAALGLDLARTLNGSVTPAGATIRVTAPRVVAQPVEGLPRASQPVKGADGVAAYVQLHGPCRNTDMVRAGLPAANIQRARQLGLIRRTDDGTYVLGTGMRTKNARPRPGGGPKRRRVPISMDDIVRYVAEHPGSTSTQIAAGLGHPTEVQTVRNRMALHAGAVRVERITGAGTGAHGAIVRYYPLEADGDAQG